MIDLPGETVPSSAEGAPEINQEAIMEQHCTCMNCGRFWVVAKEVGDYYDLSCCGWTRVRERVGQLLFSDHRGAWIRRTA